MRPLGWRRKIQNAPDEDGVSDLPWYTVTIDFCALDEDDAYKFMDECVSLRCCPWWLRIVPSWLGLHRRFPRIFCVNGNWVGSIRKQTEDDWEE